MKSCDGADYVVMVDTGSTDGTMGAFIGATRTSAFWSHPCTTNGDAPSISIKPFRFDTALNAALALVPGDVDVCIALDLDEVLAPGWRDVIEQDWQPESTRARYPFILERNEAGTVTKQMVGHRIHARHGYDWKYPCHEALIAKHGLTESIAHLDGLVIEHLPDKTKSRSQYIGMLAKAIQEFPDDPRMLFYYGRELMYGEAWIEAVKTLKRYLAVETIWKEQRAEAMRYLAKCLSRTNEGQHEAAGWLTQACIESPHERINWVEFAEHRRQQGDWAGGVWGIQNALACAERPDGGYFEPYMLSVSPYDIGGMCAFYLGLKDQAQAWMREALARDPGNKRLKTNLAFVTPA